MTPEVNIMVDIETLSTRPDATILSIGAVCLETDMEFYAEIDPRQDRHVDVSTVMWWFEQPIKPPLDSTLTLGAGLYAFSDFCKSQATNKKFKFWSKGPHFDATTLADAYGMRGIECPWEYSSVRDYRTLAKLLPHIPKPPFQGDKHNALADAKNQAAHLKLLLAEFQKC